MTRRKLPSVGFAVVIVTYCLLAAFLLWGIATPDLDRVWTLHHVLKIGELERLDREDKRLLKNAMSRHSNLAAALVSGENIGIISAHLDGWIATPCATVIRTVDSKKYKSLELNIQTPEDLMPVKIKIEGSGWRDELKASGHGRYSVDLPGPVNSPEIIEMCLVGKEAELDPSVLGVRLTFGEKN